MQGNLFISIRSLPFARKQNKEAPSKRKVILACSKRAKYQAQRNNTEKRDPMWH